MGMTNIKSQICLAALLDSQRPASGRNSLPIHEAGLQAPHYSTECEMNTAPGIIWIKIAVVYLVLGVSLGIYMGASGDHTLHPVHAHINLLGWATMTLIGLIYRHFPEMARSPLARIQFWLHNLSLPVLMVALTLLMRGNESLEPVVGIGSAVVGASVAMFAVNVFKNMKAQVD